MTQPTSSREPLAFSQLKIAYGWKCNASCGHCAVSSGPLRCEVLGLERLLACVDAAAELGMASLELTGGEIFLFYRELVAALARAHGHGLEVHVNTNACWAKSPALARRRLAALQPLGLTKLILSTDRYHQEFIPLARVLNALAAARALGIAATVTVCHLADDPDLLATVAALHPCTSQIKLQSIAPYGRAAGLERGRMACCPLARAGRPCDGGGPTVSPDGRVTLCCAPPMWFAPEIAQRSPLVLGWLDREPLPAILERARRDPFLQLLAAEGLAGIAARLETLAPGVLRPRPEGYFGSCDLCAAVLGSQPLLDRVAAFIPALVAGAR